MKAYRENPLLIPFLIFTVGGVNTFLNPFKTIEEAWWYTLFPLGVGFLWFVIRLLVLMREE